MKHRSLTASSWAWPVLPFALLAGLLAGLCPAAQAQDTQSQWWPELDTYLTLNQRFRVSVSASRKTDGDSGDSIQVGPNLDVTLRSVRGKHQAQGNDASKRKFLTFRAGYRYVINSGKADEQRGILELTPRYYLPWAMLLSDRNRADLRVIGGDFSWRYRNRLTLERDFKIKSVSLTPYLRGELLYDSRYGIWNRNSYSFGVIFPVHKHFELEPYFTHQNDSRSSPAHINAVGFTFSLYFERGRRRQP
ncbi:MAG TPA: DUF2490 domain-containing protein [Terriglobales bacterium]|nr:DUF2490 domain-containing protein [Terriglobales bacterium]